MIYIFSGNNTKKINMETIAITKNRETIFLSGASVSKEILNDYAGSTSLFGESPIIILDNVLKESGLVFSKEELMRLKETPTAFIFREDTLLASTLKKYEKYATIERFDEKNPSSAPQVDTFAIAQAYGRKDKIKTWVLYREAIERGVSPEALSGMIFWKIKSMILEKNTVFTDENLKKQSGKIVSLYHLAHRGECDLAMGMEQFILSNL